MISYVWYVSLIHLNKMCFTFLHNKSNKQFVQAKTLAAILSLLRFANGYYAIRNPWFQFLHIIFNASFSNFSFRLNSLFLLSKKVKHILLRWINETYQTYDIINSKIPNKNYYTQQTIKMSNGLKRPSATYRLSVTCKLKNNLDKNNNYNLYRTVCLFIFDIWIINTIKN